MTGNVSALFRAAFGVAPRVVASAPGRVNLIGEHTDYNGGPVLPLATAARTSVAVGPGDDGVLELISTLDGERVRIDWHEGRPAGWTAYVAGVMRELDAAGAAPRGAGARVAVASDVPIGAGLASSAALTVATAQALSLLARVRLNPRQLAGVAFRAEHDYVGVGCGIMDQMCTALARPGHALLLECASLAARHIPSRGRLLLVDTGTRHELSSRALHVVGETARTRFGAQLLTRGRMRRFGELLYEAHESCRRLYQCSAPELDLVVAAARRAGALGARLTGAGWGGAVLVLLGKGDGGRGKGEAKVAKEIRRAFTAVYGREPSITRVRPSGGARGKAVTERGARAGFVKTLGRQGDGACLRYP